MTAILVVFVLVLIAVFGLFMYLYGFAAGREYQRDAAWLRASGGSASETKKGAQGDGRKE